ncbi:hypothetical protein C3747_43g159 [Trypanosoma cruzi]|uniref:MIT domain-containing protein n=2 Tax=Trypanosoma cruzi TaxID=5693 RepID=Q4DFU7_TRYCC|nr:hypothetical protein, conserved [Trypanosoma cruzi]EAN91393.1 hypothetical protein, conserved [Trypanosoma cruzi]PWV13506.1 hypothetical protein C3747_43g159 [Trypanosoma cruzi]|eukprot:XP_813244.1 hypothetical protein [Trypanosoma cruzi strain CL Brener]
MTALARRVQQAADFIYRARQEETPDGNPLVAARNYITAMEIIAAVADEVPTKDVNERRFLLHQLRQRMEMYYERAELLLGVAEESGLVDKPTAEGGLPMAPHFPRGDGHVASFTTVEALACDSVMGIPLSAGEGNSNVPHTGPPMQYYFSEPPPVPPPAPPPVEAEDPLEALIKTMSFDDEKKD